MDQPGRRRVVVLGGPVGQAASLGVLDADGKADADAVPVPVMDGWLTDAIEALQDPARRVALEAGQERERKGILARVLARLNGKEDG